MYAAIHSKSGAYANCAAQESAEDVPALLAEIIRLRAELAKFDGFDSADLDELRDNARPPEYCLSCLNSNCFGCTTQEG
jgi:Zn-dependent oligopeptidase